MEFRNTYEDAMRASAYDELECGGTYDLVFRALPGILERHVCGKRALDFGCGTGRSSRFLTSLGYCVTGIDISSQMLEIARQRDPDGDYRVIEDGDFRLLPNANFDLILSAFTFDNIPGFTHKIDLFRGLGHLLKPSGTLIHVVSTPEIYTHEWVTFSTQAFPANRLAQSGDTVRIVTTEYSDQRPVEDILFTHDDYLTVFEKAGLRVTGESKPLADGTEGISWVNEMRIAPWAIYTLQR